MAHMATALSTQTDEAHEAEVAKQAEIAAEILGAEGEEETPEEEVPVSEEEVVNPEPEPIVIQLKEDVEIEYPLSISLVGSDDLVFSGPDDVVEVPPSVAEQLTYSPDVEAAA